MIFDGGKNNFHGIQVLGQTEVTPEVRAKLMSALYDGMTRRGVFRAACFEPRHGIHAVLGNKSADMLICFHCMQFVIFPGPKDYTTAVSKTEQPVFDRVLTDAGVPLSAY
jgi:hypothetical protein